MTGDTQVQDEEARQVAVLILNKKHKNYIQEIVELEIPKWRLVVLIVRFGLSVSTVNLIAGLECQIRDSAIAQGILAQNRILGGSIRIAAATAILSATESRELAGIVSVSQLSSLRAIAAELSPAQQYAIRKAYSDAFTDSMHVCTAVAGLMILVTLFLYQRNPLGMEERRQQQLREHIKRLQPRDQAKVDVVQEV